MSDLADLADLESMARTATEASILASEYAGRERWMKLFGYGTLEADAAIEAHFADASRELISNEQFQHICNLYDLENHEEESFAHLLKRSGTTLARFLQRQTAGLGTERDKDYTYLVRFGGVLTAADIQRIGALAEPPKVVTNEKGEATAAVVDGKTRDALDGALPGLLEFVPISIVRLAEKNLSSFSMAPTLGIDATLPQYRLATMPIPHQDQYPVSYFFYGTLAVPEKLRQVLELEDEPVLSPAEIRRGRKLRWGKYPALVDGAEGNVVRGWTYVVETREHEDRLRSYETNKYEVVRCEIWSGGSQIPGLTFRFCGKREELA